MTKSKKNTVIINKWLDESLDYDNQGSVRVYELYQFAKVEIKRLYGIDITMEEFVRDFFNFYHSDIFRENKLEIHVDLALVQPALIKGLKFLKGGNNE